MAVINAPFESKYGFKGPGFLVDELGNITAASIITSSAPTETDIVDYTITENANAFSFTTLSGDNPVLTLARSRSYKFSLILPILGFKIYQSDQTTLYNVGLAHSDGTTGANAQGKTTGTLSISLSVDAPDVLYYSNNEGTIFGTINVVDPIGVFSTVNINSTNASTSSSTGALTVAGGVGIAGDLYVAGSLNIDGIGITSISSPTNLELDASNKIVVKIDGSTIGAIGAEGLSIPITNTTINNTVIGDISPSTAAFTSATVANLPTADSSVTNRQYVDSTALSLAIAFGL